MGLGSFLTPVGKIRVNRATANSRRSIIRDRDRSTCKRDSQKKPVSSLHRPFSTPAEMPELTTESDESESETEEVKGVAAKVVDNTAITCIKQETQKGQLPQVGDLTHGAKPSHGLRGLSTQLPYTRHYQSNLNFASLRRLRRLSCAQYKCLFGTSHNPTSTHIEKG